MNRKSIVFLLILGMFANLLTACGKGTNGSSNIPDDINDEEVKTEDIASGIVENEFFIWDGKTIIGLTELGKEQENLVIPEECTGFDILNFSLGEAKSISFEGNEDVKLNRCFTSDTKLETVTLPDNLIEIEDMEFMSCTSLKEITIPEGVEKFGESAFSGCTSLKEVSFQTSGLSKIGDYAFQICPIETVIIPEGVEEIGEYSFYQCDQLRTITLPSSLKKIGSMGFGSENIEEVHFSNETIIESIDPMAFGTSVLSMTVYIGEGSWMDQNREAWDIGFGSIAYE